MCSYIDTLMLCRQREPRRQELLGSMVPVMGPVLGSRLRKWRWVSTASTSVSFVESMQWKGRLLGYGDAKTVEKLRPVVHTHWTLRVLWLLGVPSEGWGSRRRVKMALIFIIFVLLICEFDWKIWAKCFTPIGIWFLLSCVGLIIQSGNGWIDSEPKLGSRLVVGKDWEVLSLCSCEVDCLHVDCVNAGDRKSVV